jgi:hypothetical protein
MTAERAHSDALLKLERAIEHADASESEEIE